MPRPTQGPLRREEHRFWQGLTWIPWKIWESGCHPSLQLHNHSLKAVPENDAVGTAATLPLDEILLACLGLELQQRELHLPQAPRNHPDRGWTRRNPEPLSEPPEARRLAIDMGRLYILTHQHRIN